jgi:hypothetical protein
MGRVLEMTRETGLSQSVNESTISALQRSTYKERRVPNGRWEEGLGGWPGSQMGRDVITVARATETGL